jgi:hypothetical protein
MGRGMDYENIIIQFVEDLPPAKLEGGFPDGDTVYSDRYLRLDNQRTVTKADGTQYFNLQVQVNKGCPHTTLAKMAPDSVAICLAPVKNPWTAAQIKKALLATVTGMPI